MPSKLDFYSQMADHTARQFTGSFVERNLDPPAFRLYNSRCANACSPMTNKKDTRSAHVP